MADRSAIEWTDATWNPVSGCSKVSPGCAHCYAEAMTKRFGGDFSKVTLHSERLDQPLRWRKPRRIFVDSMSDTFHHEVPDAFIDRIFATLARCPQHTFLILTKRPERMNAYFSEPNRAFAVLRAIDTASIDEGSETWRAVPGYEEYYEASTLGRVRRSGGIRRGQRNPDGILSPRVTRGGYLAICLSRAGEVRQARLNRVILETFGGPPPTSISEARHRNGERTDNRAANLCWGSKADNMGDASRHGTAGAWMKSQASFTSSEVEAIRAARGAGAKLVELAARHYSTKQQISEICLGQTYKAPAIDWPLPHIWLGVSVENQRAAEERIPLLLQTPAAVRFVSCEPLLEGLNLASGLNFCENCMGGENKPLSFDYEGNCLACHGQHKAPSGLDWMISGGESGPKARRAELAWFRGLQYQCWIAGVPYFQKQLGSGLGRELGCRDRKGGDMDAWPADLRIREWPA